MYSFDFLTKLFVEAAPFFNVICMPKPNFDVTT